MTTRPRSWLFFKERFAWPRASGHDVHTFHMMRALAQRGDAVHLATRSESPPEALAGVPFASVTVLDSWRGDPAPDWPVAEFTRAQAKFRDYWGVPTPHVRQLGSLAERHNVDAVVVSGLSVLPYLGAVHRAKRIWYAADEWAWHHWSMAKLTRPGTWGEVKDGLIKLAYERAFRRKLDRVWAVTGADRSAFRYLAGVANVDVVPNGVDADHFAPSGAAIEPHVVTFWGRLDFGPNVQALEFFVTQVWPLVRAAVPGAEFRVYGFQPTPEVRALLRSPGVSLEADLPDLRAEIGAAAVVVLPFTSGGGIKNKLLEAAAMGKAIVAAPRAKLGLVGEPPLRIASGRSQWAGAVAQLLGDGAARDELGGKARAWVRASHTWAAAAGAVSAPLDSGDSHTQGGGG